MLWILSVLILVVVLYQAELAQSFHNKLEIIIFKTADFLQGSESSRFTLAHLESNVKTVISNLLSVSSDHILISAVKSPVFRGVYGYLLKAEKNFLTVCDDLGELEYFLIASHYFSHKFSSPLIKS